MYSSVKREDLSKLWGVPLICAVVALFMNILLLAAISSYAWVKATVLAAGQPFTAYLSLLSVKFGKPLDPSADNIFFCSGSSDNCDLGLLCNAPDSPDAFPNLQPKNTPPHAWCIAAKAGALCETFLWLGFLPGLAAAASTFLYAAKDVPNTAPILLKIEELGLTARLQKLVIVSCWGVLSAFMFIAMLVYATMIPESLGWGFVTLEASFGLLRFTFIVASVFGAVLASNLFTLWTSENVVEVWMEFLEANLLSAKKVLYLELMTQLALYLVMTVHVVDWSGLLIVLAVYYIDAKRWNFLLMYLLLVTISILFDLIQAASLPSFENMTPGEAFGNSLWVLIFLLKPLILATIFMYEKYEKPLEDMGGDSYSTIMDAGRPEDEIAE